MRVIISHLISLTQRLAHIISPFDLAGWLAETRHNENNNESEQKLHLSAAADCCATSQPAGLKAKNLTEQRLCRPPASSLSIVARTEGAWQAEISSHLPPIRLVASSWPKLIASRRC